LKVFAHDEAFKLIPLRPINNRKSGNHCALWYALDIRAGFLAAIAAVRRSGAGLLAVEDARRRHQAGDRLAAVGVAWKIDRATAAAATMRRRCRAEGRNASACGGGSARLRKAYAWEDQE
jgi:hypothetical protein